MRRQGWRGDAGTAGFYPAFNRNKCSLCLNLKQPQGIAAVRSDAEIWFGAVLRGDDELIDVGEGSNMQEGAMLHTKLGFPLVLGADVTVGHHAILHGCEVGAGSLIMGSPAKAVRDLDATAIKGLRTSALDYCAKWRRFSAKLHRLGEV